MNDESNPFATGESEVPDPGGYSLLALMNDGGTLCESCVRDADNPVHDRRQHDDITADGWGVVFFYTSGDVDTGGAICDHCGKVVVESTDEDDQ